MARFVLGLLAVVGLSASPEAGQVVFRGGVELVTFGVTVLDRKGNLVTDLRQDEFRVVEDGRAQQLEFLPRPPTPAKPWRTPRSPTCTRGCCSTRAGAWKPTWPWPAPPRSSS